MSRPSSCKALPPPDELRSRLKYDPETGIFSWVRHAGAVSKRRERAGSLDSRGYVQIHASGRGYRAHRLAWWFVYGEWPELLIDHIDGNPANNRISNLRLATEPQNMWNAKGARGKLKGAFWCPYSRKFYARISVNKRRIRLGYFDTAEAAHEAYAEAAKRLHGEFARFE